MLYLIPIFMPPASTSPNIDNSLVLPVLDYYSSTSITSISITILVLPVLVLLHKLLYRGMKEKKRKIAELEMFIN